MNSTPVCNSSTWLFCPWFSGDFEQALSNIGAEAIDYLEDRDIDRMNSSQIINTARAYRTVGEALLYTKSQDQAEESFKNAYRLSNLVLISEKMNEAAIFERGNASYWIGNLDYIEKRYDKAKTHWLNYQRDSLMLKSISPNNHDWIQEASYSENVLGTLALRQGDVQTAKIHFDNSVRFKTLLKEGNRSNLDYQFDYIDSLSWVASTLEASGNLSEASSEYDRLISMLSSLIKEHKEANRWRSRLANYKMLSTRLEIGMGKNEKAYTSASDAVRIMEQLVSLSPDNGEWLKDLAKARLILIEAAKLKSDRSTIASQLTSLTEELSRLDRQTKNSIGWRWIDARARFAHSLLLNTDAAPSIETEKAIADLAMLSQETSNEDILESYALALLLRGRAPARCANKTLAKSDHALAASMIERIKWKNSPSRSWIWSKAMSGIGNSEKAEAVDAWLLSIGYKRE